MALNLAPTTPDWLSDYGASPMKLGLDLSGGVHFKLEVDVDAAVERRMEYYVNGIKRALREERIRGLVTLNEQGQVEARFKTEELREQARDVIADASRSWCWTGWRRATAGICWRAMPEQTRKEIAEYSVSQNLTTLRNRVNELGVSEPLVQRQGQNRIVVELPGIQDTAEAKRILGKVANLEFRLVANLDAPPSEKQRFEYRSADRAGDGVAGARCHHHRGAGFQCPGQFRPERQPNVKISLDSEGGTLMSRATRNNIKRRMGVLFIERKYRTRYESAGRWHRSCGESALRREETADRSGHPVGPGCPVPDYRPGQPAGIL